MSHIIYDGNGRYRDRTVAFRVSSEEAEEITRAAKLSGFTKREYIYKKLMNQDIVVVPSSRLYKLILEQTEYLATELKKLLKSGKPIDPELKRTVELLTNTINGLKGNDDNGE